MAATADEVLPFVQRFPGPLCDDVASGVINRATQPASRSDSPLTTVSFSPAANSHQLPSPAPTPRMRHAAPPPLPTIPSDSDTSSIMSSASSSSGENVKPRSRNLSVDGAGAGDNVVGGDHSHHADDEPERHGKSRSVTITGPPPSAAGSEQGGVRVRRLSALEMQELSRPELLPVGPAPPAESEGIRTPTTAQYLWSIRQSMIDGPASAPMITGGEERLTPRRAEGPGTALRTASTPPTNRTLGDAAEIDSPRRYSLHPVARPAPLDLALEPPIPFPAFVEGDPRPAQAARPPSPIPPSIPLPPMSLHTHLQLELAGQRPSPLYIHHSHTSDIPYESSAVKFERLKSVMMLPPYLERTLMFGALACLDAWLFTFTILPIRSIAALGVLAKWWGYVLAKEARWIVGFVWYGLGRIWARTCGRWRGMPLPKQGTRLHSETGTVVSISETSANPAERSAHPGKKSTQASGSVFRHRRAASLPSNLSSCNKADLLQGALIVVTSVALMRLDASRMYHFIRAQSAIKLYVIYSVLEVGDRLLSALGQDILECLFSSETLSRNSLGRSKVLLPFGMFLLALAYNVIHSIALYYQVITLNVAVNSYSNALLTLLLSNQFVEIKSTVFKRIEKDNLFQLTCADIVERFQLWIMLLIIALRNIVEVGGLSVPGAGMGGGSADDNSRPAPLHSASILPHSFTVLPSWIWTGAVLSPFLIVTFSEVVVDTIKHAYVVKFNNIKPTFYARILDIICKDYYNNAFTTPALTRRLGLAVIPMACLFIRSSIQTYHMFLATNLPAPLPASTQTSLATTSSATPSSAPFLAALDRLDSLLRDALGRSVYSHPYAAAGRARPWWSWTSDDVVAAATMLVFFFILFLVLLIAKLLLGMLLLRYARNRYTSMKQKEHMVSVQKGEHENHDARGRRVGAYAQVQVPDDVKRWVNANPDEGPRRRPKEDDGGNTGAKAPVDGGAGACQPYSGNGVERFEMVAKRIW